MTDNWCPKHLRTIGALVPCGECEEERKGPKRYHYMHDGDGYDARLVSIPSGIKKEDLRGDYVNASDYDALLATVSALEKEVAGLRKDAERYRFLTNLPKTQAQAFFWTWDSRKQRAEAIDAQLAAMRTGEGA